MEAMPELPVIKSEIKAEDFISVGTAAGSATPNVQQENHSPHHQPQQAGTPNLVDHQLQSAAACGWVGNLSKFKIFVISSKFRLNIVYYL